MIGGREKGADTDQVWEEMYGEKREIWPKKSKTRTYFTVDPCITNRVMGD